MKKLKTLEEVGTLEIDRSRWLCGTTSGPNKGSSMYDRERKMCCLGFLAKAQGVPVKHLQCQATPRAVSNHMDRENIPGQMVDGYSTEFAGVAMSINDNALLKTQYRETRLKALFKDEGIKLKFVGKYPKK